MQDDKSPQTPDPNRHAKRLREKTDEELARASSILSEQADRFASQFHVDVSSAEKFPSYSGALRSAAEAYERIAVVQQNVGRNTWLCAENVDGRTGDEIMERIWAVREELRERHDEK